MYGTEVYSVFRLMICKCLHVGCSVSADVVSISNLTYYHRARFICPLLSSLVVEVVFIENHVPFLCAFPNTNYARYSTKSFLRKPFALQQLPPIILLGHHVHFLSLLPLMSKRRTLLPRHTTAGPLRVANSVLKSVVDAS